MGAPAALLLLADGRFPAGGHAHSAGVESAVADGRVHDEASLARFVDGRLATAALVDASFAAATLTRLATSLDLDTTVAVVNALDAEVNARLVAPAVRHASRRLGRRLAQVAGECWPAAALDALREAFPDGLHWPVALGAVGHAVGLGPDDVARLAVHHAVTTPVQAAVRLLGLDPYAAAALGARAAVAGEAVVATAVATAGAPLADLPATSDPLVEIAAVEHRGWDVRMFAT